MKKSMKFLRRNEKTQTLLSKKKIIFLSECEFFLMKQKNVCTNIVQI